MLQQIITNAAARKAVDTEIEYPLEGKAVKNTGFNQEAWKDRYM